MAILWECDYSHFASVTGCQWNQCFYLYRKWNCVLERKLCGLANLLFMPLYLLFCIVISVADIIKS